jgi:exosortase
MKYNASSLLSKTTVLALAASILFLVAYLPILHILVKVWWESEEYSHAFLTLLVIAYMVWTKWDAIAKNKPKYAGAGFALLVFSTLLYFLSLTIQMRTIIAFSMFLTLVGTIIYTAGIKTLRDLTTPLLLLVMLIPVPDKLYIQLTFPLQLKVSQISEMLVRLFEVPILREGNIMNIPGKSFEVVEACSGMRSAVALLTLSVIIGFFWLNKKSSKFLLAMASVPTAIFVNILRVTVMILLFHFFGMDLSEGALHTVTGMSVFLVAALLLYIFERVLRWLERKSTSS